MARIPRTTSGSNDHYVSHDGRVVSGRLEPPLNDLLERQAALQDRIKTQLLEEGMLKGTGFIVIDPADPRFSGDEHEDMEEAKLVGSNLAYQSRAGYIIVYAPIAVMRPKRETADTIPSKLLQQIGTRELGAGDAAAQKTAGSSTAE